MLLWIFANAFLWSLSNCDLSLAAWYNPFWIKLFSDSNVWQFLPNPLSWSRCHSFSSIKCLRSIKSCSYFFSYESMVRIICSFIPLSSLRSTSEISMSDVGTMGWFNCTCRSLYVPWGVNVSLLKHRKELAVSIVEFAV